MWLRLAAAWGCTLGEARERCATSEEFGLWQAWYGIDPWGPERADLSRGILASLYATYKSGETRRPSEFMPYAQDAEANSDGGQSETEMRREAAGLGKAVREI